MAYRSTNPYTNKVEKSFEELSDEQLQAKLQTALTTSGVARVLRSESSCSSVRQR